MSTINPPCPNFPTAVTGTFTPPFRGQFTVGARLKIDRLVNCGTGRLSLVSRVAMDRIYASYTGRYRVNPFMKF